MKFSNNENLMKKTTKGYSLHNESEPWKSSESKYINKHFGDFKQILH